MSDRHRVGFATRKILVTDWPALLSASLVLLALVAGAFYFRRTERTIVDLI